MLLHLWSGYLLLCGRRLCSARRFIGSAGAGGPAARRTFRQGRHLTSRGRRLLRCCGCCGRRCLLLLCTRRRCQVRGPLQRRRGRWQQLLRRRQRRHSSAQQVVNVWQPAAPQLGGRVALRSLDARSQYELPPQPCLLCRLHGHQNQHLVIVSTNEFWRQHSRVYATAVLQGQVQHLECKQVKPEWHPSMFMQCHVGLRLPSTCSGETSSATSTPAALLTPPASASADWSPAQHGMTLCSVLDLLLRLKHDTQTISAAFEALQFCT